MVVAVTFPDVVLTLHILAVVVTFGGALTYPLWFRMVRAAAPAQRAFFHHAQTILGRFLITPGVVVIFATGAYLASDSHTWGEAWVIIPAAILAIILLLGFAILGPGEELLSRAAEGGDRLRYDITFSRVRATTWLAVVLVVAATFMMVAHVPQ